MSPQSIGPSVPFGDVRNLGMCCNTNQANEQSLSITERRIAIAATRAKLTIMLRTRRIILQLIALVLFERYHPYQFHQSTTGRRLRRAGIFEGTVAGSPSSHNSMFGIVTIDERSDTNEGSD